MEIKYYTEEEKEIFTDFFIHKTDGCRKRFDAYIQQFYQSLNIPELDKADTWSQNKNYKMGLSFNTHHMMWDKNNNLITEFLNNPRFSFSSKSLHQLNLVHPNWNYINNNGENALFILTRKGYLTRLDKIIKDFSIDVNLKNKDDQYFTHLFFDLPSVFKSDNIGTINMNFFVKILTYLNTTEIFLKKYPEHLDVSWVRLNKMSEQWNNSLDYINHLYEKNTDLKLTSSGFNLIIKKWQDINNLVQAHELKAKLEFEMPIKDIIRRPKI